MSVCTNERKTCTYFDCPLKSYAEAHPLVADSGNCMRYCIEHRDEIEDAARAFEVEMAKRRGTIQ